jgi:hypothetical protein
MVQTLTVEAAATVAGRVADKLDRPAALRFVRRAFWRILRSYDRETYAAENGAALKLRAALIVESLERGTISDEDSRVAGALALAFLREIARIERDAGA